MLGLVFVKTCQCAIRFLLLDDVSVDSYARGAL